MKYEDVPNLNKALAVLLYDQYNCPDVEAGEHDDTFVEYIIYALIEKNGNVCPYKNYSSEQSCKCYKESCEEGLYFDCKRDPEDAWKDFIGIEESEVE